MQNRWESGNIMGGVEGGQGQRGADSCDGNICDSEGKGGGLCPPK